MNSKQLFESLSRRTWETLCDAETHGISFGEETITDINLLDMARENCNDVKVFKTPKNLEKSKGTDWEWWIGRNNLGWIRYAVQAKKITFQNDRYDHLKHTVGSNEQIDILEDYARLNHAIPLYCFYNYTPRSTNRNWKCGQLLEKPQLGCTITPSSNIRDCLSRRGAKNFQSVHRFRNTYPWRCLVCCPLILRFYENRDADLLNSKFGFGQIQIYEQLPEVIQRMNESYSAGEYILNEINDSNIEYAESTYPNRFLIANIPENDSFYQTC